MGEITKRRKAEQQLYKTFGAKLNAEHLKRRRLEDAIRKHHQEVGADNWDADADLWAVLSLPAHPR